MNNKLDVLLYCLATCVCAIPFVRIMLKWDLENEEKRKNDHKMHLMMLFILFVIPTIIGLLINYYKHR